MTKDFIDETMKDYRAKFGGTYCDGNCIMFNEVVPNFLRSALQSQRTEMMRMLPEEIKDIHKSTIEMAGIICKEERQTSYAKGYNAALSAFKETLQA